MRIALSSIVALALLTLGCGIGSADDSTRDGESVEGDGDEASELEAGEGDGDGDGDESSPSDLPEEEPAVWCVVANGNCTVESGSCTEPYSDPCSPDVGVSACIFVGNPDPTECSYAPSGECNARLGAIDVCLLDPATMEPVKPMIDACCVCGALSDDRWCEPATDQSACDELAATFEVPVEWYDDGCFDGPEGPVCPNYCNNDG